MYPPLDMNCCRHAIVEELAELGVTVHTCARNQTDIDRCLSEWQNKGYKVTASVCDILLRDQRQKLVENVSCLFDGKLNTLVNNSGIAVSKEAVEYTAEDMKMVMGTNFESAYHLSQLSHPLLKASGNGNIINISSIGSFLSFPQNALYASSKGAMNQMTRSLACEWARDNIRVNAIAPGLIQTSMLKARNVNYITVAKLKF
ncbi:Tropinone reductase 1 [Linum grandiflorum]